MKHFFRHIHREIWHMHLFDYTFMVLAAGMFVYATRYFVGYRQMQFYAVLAFTSLYILWGVYHHIVTRSFRLRILLEYALIGFMILFFSLTLIFP